MAFNIGGRTISFEEYSRLSTLTPRPRLPLRTAHPPAVSNIDPESPRKCGTSLTNKLWLRICVACGVLRDIPIPSGDRLVSLRPGRSARTCIDNQTGCWNIRGRLVAAPAFDPDARLSPPYRRLHVTASDRAPAPACPRTSRETLRRRKREDCRRGAGQRGKSRARFSGISKCHHWCFVTACDRKARYK